MLSTYDQFNDLYEWLIYLILNRKRRRETILNRIF